VLDKVAPPPTSAPPPTPAQSTPRSHLITLFKTSRIISTKKWATSRRRVLTAPCEVNGVFVVVACRDFSSPVTILRDNSSHINMKENRFTSILPKQGLEGLWAYNHTDEKSTRREFAIGTTSLERVIGNPAGRKFPASTSLRHP